MASRGYLSRRSRKPNNCGQKSIIRGQRKKKLPPWDSTISNLLVHKPTKQELRRRHELHQPVQRLSESPTSSIEFEQISGAPGSELETFKTPESTRDVRYSVLREIMNTNEKLQKALTYSDKKMSAVPDLFGDDPKKFRGFPNITCAPVQKQKDDSETVRKSAFMKEPTVGASNLDILSDTVMDGTALNDVTELQQNTDENNNVEQTSSTSRHATSQHPVNGSPTMQHSSPSSTRSTLFAGAPEIRKESDHREAENCNEPTEKKIFHERKMEESRKGGQGRKAPIKPNSVPQSTVPDLKGLQDLREMVDNLEEEVRLFEQETGREQPSMSSVTMKKASFGGFTVSILHAITKLVGYLRTCEKQRKSDIILKQDIFITLQQQQMLIDALTNEVISLQQENRKVQEELETSKETTEEQIKYIKRELYVVLKSHEYETLSSDMDFLYERNVQTTQSGHPQGTLEGVVRSHGIRDNFDYQASRTKDDVVKLTDQTYSKNEHHSDKSILVTDTRTIHEETTPRTFEQSETTVPQTTRNITSNTSSPRNSQDPEPPDRIPQFHEQEKTPASETTVNNHPLPSDHEIDTVPYSTGDFVTPSPSLSKSGMFTYYNPVLTNTLGNESLISPTSSEKYVHEDLNGASFFIGRNQTTSPRRRGKHDDENIHSITRTDDSPTSDVTTTNQSKRSPRVSPVLFDRQLLPDRPGQEKVVVRLPSMWQDSHTGMQRKPPTPSLTKQAVKQQSDNGWFALSSHVNLK